MPTKIGFKLNRRLLLISIFFVILITGGLYWSFSKNKEIDSLIVSTTTSLYETGLLNEIKAKFETKYPKYNVSFISQGTGLAIETAKRGDADIILVHSPNQERSFVESGYGINRKIFAYNFFIIVGPKNDPASIQGITPIEALKKIREKGSTGNALWVSRGDNSGTHSKEKTLWKETGLSLDEIKLESMRNDASTWYIEAGSGMTATLQLANQKDAYTLTDVATYLKNFKNGNIELIKLIDSGEQTLNVYSAIICNPEKNPRGLFDVSMKFVEFLVGIEIQKELESYGFEEFGSTLFNPWIPELSNPGSKIVSWVTEQAYFEGSECPPKFRYKEGNLYN